MNATDERLVEVSETVSAMRHSVADADPTTAETNCRASCASPPPPPPTRAPDCDNAKGEGMDTRVPKAPDTLKKSLQCFLMHFDASLFLCVIIYLLFSSFFLSLQVVVFLCFIINDVEGNLGSTLSESSVHADHSHRQTRHDIANIVACHAFGGEGS